MGVMDALDALTDWFGNQIPEYSTPIKFANALNLITAIQAGKIDALIEEVEIEFMAVVKSSSPYAFAKRWMWMRNWLPLQLRLFLEQVFWRLGKPYTDLITGFGPISLEEFKTYAGTVDIRGIEAERARRAKGGIGGEKIYKRRPPRVPVWILKARGRRQSQQRGTRR